MTISEARAALPEVVSRVTEGEEVTITRHGRPAAVVVRPDIMWAQSGTEIIFGPARDLAAALRERAVSNGHSLEEEIEMILRAAGEAQPAPLPPIQLVTVKTSGRSTWPREEIYDDEGR